MNARKGKTRKTKNEIQLDFKHKFERFQWPRSPSRSPFLIIWQTIKFTCPYYSPGHGYPWWVTIIFYNISKYIYLWIYYFSVYISSQPESIDFDQDSNSSFDASLINELMTNCQNNPPVDMSRNVFACLNPPQRHVPAILCRLGRFFYEKHIKQWRYWRTRIQYW